MPQSARARLFGAVKTIAGHSKVRDLRFARDKRDQRPARVKREVDKLLWANLEWHRETMPQFARSSSNLGHVDSRHNRFIANRFGPVDQLEGAGAIAAKLELEPDVPFRHLDQRFHRCRCDCGDAQWHLRAHCQPHQHHISTWTRKVAHAHWTDAKWGLGGHLAGDSCHETVADHDGVFGDDR